MDAVARRQVEVEIATWALSKDGECGDHYLVERFKDGALVAVVDGIGHGVEAAKVAKLTLTILKEQASLPVDELIQQCHAALRATRGVVVALASFNTRTRTMTWTGVGNVEGKLFTRAAASAPTTLLSSMGTLGQGMVEVRPTEVPLKSGDTLILATDGVRSDFYLGLGLKKSPKQLADSILERSAHRTDDALVAVARYTE